MMKIAKEIATEVYKQFSGRNHVIHCTESELESIIAGHLGPVRKALEGLADKAGKQNWNDKYPDQLDAAYDVLAMLEEER